MDWLIQRISSFVLRRSFRWQAESQLRNLDLWRLSINEFGHIAVDGMDVTDLVKRFGSPLLVVNKKKLLEDISQMQDALAPAPSGSRIFYSYKTNCIPGILEEIHNKQIGAEVISPYELWLAERLGVPGDMIIYNGVNKTEESIERAARLDILSINIDHFEEIHRIYRIAESLNKRVRVGVRLGLISGSQFGMEIENGAALQACREIISRSEHLELVGIQFNVTSNAWSSSLHRECALKAVEFMAKVKRETGVTIASLDIGGGFGVPTTKNMSATEYAVYRTLGALPKSPSIKNFQPINAFLSEIIDCVREDCRAKGIEMPAIFVEPGRFITSRSEFLLAKVLTIKEKKDGKRFAITDAGRLSLTFPCDFEYHEVFVADRPNAPLTIPYQIMGRICTSADWMFKNRLLPELKPGDVLAVMDAGAYFSSYSTNFAFARPPIIMVSNETAQVIRQEETFEHLIALDRLSASHDVQE